jgi:diguanylate cyclase (GGDEF)-like protein
MQGQGRVMRLGLGAKFTLTVLTILACTMAANTLYSLYTSTRFHEKQLVERGRALGRLISLVSPEAILGFDFLLLNEYTRQVSAQPDVVYGVIISTKGAPLSAYIDNSDPLVRSRIQATGSTDITRLLQELDGLPELIRLEFPIVHNDVQLGRFQVGLSKQSLHTESRRQLAFQIVALTVLVLFLCTAIYLAFRVNVLFPIKALISASRNVGRGQYTLVEVKSEDELGQLAKAFNAMAEEVRREQAKLHRQANFDTLTGLPNRLMAMDRINQAISRARRTSQRFALFFIDLDNFKSVNDSLGHAVGDELLVATGARVQAILRDADTVARLGGDEFLVLVPDVINELQAEEIAERLVRSISQPQTLSGRKVVARCSIGIVLFPDNGDTAAALMANADNAMYQAKASGHGSAIFFTEDMNTRLRERMQMEQDLNQALELGQLALHFQPIFDASTRRHRGAEVLLRWLHPERGSISPAEFIPLAEATGQIVGIGDWVLEQACRNWSDWHRAGLGPDFLAINISRVQFRKRFARRLTELMAIYGIPPHALELEITESVLLDDHQHVAEELNSLRAVGVTLSLDDFGTGYSSLSYLKRFRFDVLKVDRSFVSGLPDKPEDALLVKAILAMAKGLDLKVVAEGVETAEQLQFLTSQGCDYAQGYLLASPMNEAGYRDYLETVKADCELVSLAATRTRRRLGTSG